LRKNGFTLIEILIAVFILGIVLTTVYASYTGTFRIVRDTRDDAEIYGMARSALDRMARDLQSVTPYRGAFTFTAKPYNIGNREFTRLIFRSTAHVAFGENELPAGIAVIEYSVDEGTEKEGYTLSRSDSLFRDPEKEEAQPGGYLLCDQVENLTYLFYDETSKEVETWNSGGNNAAQKMKAPAAVAIRLSFVNKADRKRPLLFTTRIYLPFSRKEEP
jgi:prepilin-type N-terminal cleavage/methylation domain-containing protein